MSFRLDANNNSVPFTKPFQVVWYQRCTKRTPSSPDLHFHYLIPDKKQMTPYAGSAPAFDNPSVPRLFLFDTGQQTSCHRADPTSQPTPTTIRYCCCTALHKQAVEMARARDSLPVSHEMLRPTHQNTKGQPGQTMPSTTIIHTTVA